VRERELHSHRTERHVVVGADLLESYDAAHHRRVRLRVVVARAVS
jgi:hypothetical protein